MEKAYDLADLGSKLKAAGLVEAEDAAENLVKIVFQWVQESAVLSATPYDDMAVIVLPLLQTMILKEIDKIDGEVSE